MEILNRIDRLLIERGPQTSVDYDYLQCADCKKKVKVRTTKKKRFEMKRKKLFPGDEMRCPKCKGTNLQKIKSKPGSQWHGPRL